MTDDTTQQPDEPLLVSVARVSVEAARRAPSWWAREALGGGDALADICDAAWQLLREQHPQAWEAMDHQDRRSEVGYVMSVLVAQECARK